MAKHTITTETGETRTLEVEHRDVAEIREDGVLLGHVVFSYKPGTKTPQYTGTPVNGQPGLTHKTRKAAIAEVAAAEETPAEETPAAPADKLTELDEDTVEITRDGAVVAYAHRLRSGRWQGRRVGVGNGSTGAKASPEEAAQALAHLIL